MYPQEIFRAYDIRGLVDSALTPEVALAIGRALGSLANKNAISNTWVVGQDGRHHSDQFAVALVQGLQETGAQIIHIGCVPTPLMYYALAHYQVPNGVIVTASHNAIEYNGFKMVLNGQSLSGAAVLEALQQPTVTSEVVATRIDKNPIAAYQAEIVKDIKLNKPLKVVVDAGNGVAGAIAPALLEAIGCTVIPLYCEVLGDFVHHHPDPSQEKNMRDLQAAVLAHEADLGLAFDGDADRLGVVTHTGDIVWPDRLLMLYAAAVLKTHPGAHVLFDVKCSQHLATWIRQHQGVPHMTPTGHSIIKAALKAEPRAILAGELSGHLFFKDRWYGFDDAMYAAARLVELVSAAPVSLQALTEQLPQSVSTPELQIPVQDSQKVSLLARLLHQHPFVDAALITVDGLRVEEAEGWGLIRASNTTPCLVLRFEANTAVALEGIQQRFKAWILGCDPSLAIPF